LKHAETLRRKEEINFAALRIRVKKNKLGKERK